MRLDELATVIRSKNAGPCLLTLDLMFPGPEEFKHVRARMAELRRAVAELYGRGDNEVQVIDFAPANAIKIVLARDILSGDPGDRDVYGAQQHGLLLEIEI